MFPHIHCSPVCEFVVIFHTAKTGLLRRCLYMIGLVISEATLDEHVISTPVWINPNTSFHSICVCHVLCRKKVLQSLSRTSCNSLIPAIRNKSLVQSIFLVSLFSQGTPGSVCILQVLRGLACATLAWPTRQNSTMRTNASWSNQLLLIILGSCRLDSQKANR